MGLLFGWARHATGSLYVPLAMHGASNTVAALQAAVL